MGDHILCTVMETSFWTLFICDNLISICCFWRLAAGTSITVHVCVKVVKNSPMFSIVTPPT